MIASAQTGRPILTLVDLEAFDPSAPAGKEERRFCCPLPGCADKPRDASHRSLSLQRLGGFWHCHRCGQAGTLREYWPPPAPNNRAAARRAFGLSSPVTTPRAAVVKEAAYDWRTALGTTVPLAGTAGAAYLEGRCISVTLATAAGVLYAPDWYGRPAVVFPIRDRAGELVAAQGRYIDGGEQPKARTLGDLKRGVFATPGALEAATLTVVEAPIDALSLAVAGIPAFALCGTNAPDWLAVAAAFRRVHLGFDADGAGDAAAAALWPRLESLGARVERFRPWNLKDWNELLVGGELPIVWRTATDEPVERLVEAHVIEGLQAGESCLYPGCTSTVLPGTFRCAFSHDQRWEPI